VARDIPIGFLEDVYLFVKQFSSRIVEVEELLNNNRIWKNRLVGVGSVSYDQALQWGFSGVMLRSVGVN